MVTVKTSLAQEVLANYPRRLYNGHGTIIKLCWKCNRLQNGAGLPYSPQGMVAFEPEHEGRTVRISVIKLVINMHRLKRQVVLGS